MTIREIIEQYLKDNNYDGLAGDDCGCKISDLMCCDNPTPNCQPGYTITCKDCSKPNCDFRDEDQDIPCMSTEKK